MNESSFLMNAWYVAALSTEVGPEALFHRRILGQNVLLYRRQGGSPVALRDRCPHRFVPLHLGKREGDCVVCPYHALRFDPSGACTHNPHGDGKIPKAAQVRSYELQERWGFIWIWMGDEPADPAQLPDYTPLDLGHSNALGYTYMHLKANFELIMDNVMDLSHIDHVHGEIITTRGQLSPKVPQVDERNNSIVARWQWEQTPPVLIFADFLPKPKDEARHFFEITWTAPANIQLSVGATQGDGPLNLENTVGQYDLHTATPETADTTHYFFATRRNHNVDDVEFNRIKIQAMHGAFENEDGPIIEAVHAEMGGSDFFALRPVLMTNDVAAMRVRRRFEALLAAERQRKRN